MPLDTTLTQLLSALYEAHATIDQLRARVTQLEAQVASQDEQLRQSQAAMVVESAPAG